MYEYFTQQVCLNGHQLTDRYEISEEDRKDYCNLCGEKTIIVCPNCQEKIKGGSTSFPLLDPYTRNLIEKDPKLIREYISKRQLAQVPLYCHNCGKPYPWAKKIQKKEKIVQKNFESLSIIVQILSRFHIVVTQLQNRHDKRETFEVKDEYDVQYLLHGLLKIFFDDIRPEEWTPSYAGGSSKMDFLLKKQEIVIETKKTRETLKDREIGEQLIIDIQKYKSHPSCKTLICFVYDPEKRINNPKGLENDLSREDDDLIVKVLIIPKGY